MNQELKLKWHSIYGQVLFDRKIKQAWLGRVNPIICGKVNYFLNLYKAVEENKMYGQQSRCYVTACKNDLLAIDGYIRQRLRVAMIHNHPSQRKGHVMKTKWNNEYFARIGLIPAYWLYYNPIMGHSIEDYIQHMKDKHKTKRARELERMKERGEEYFTPDRFRKIQYAQRLATY